MVGHDQTLISAARLIVCDDDGVAGPVYELNPHRVTAIGRLPSNDIIIDDESCSRSHCEVRLEGTKWLLRDLGSRNGTFVNNSRVTQDWPLLNRQVVRVGGASFRFVIDGATDTGREAYDTAVALETHQNVSNHSTRVADVTLVDELEIESDTNIVHRTKESHYLMESISEERSRELAEGLGHLHRMALRTAACKTLPELADTALDGLFDALDVPTFSDDRTDGFY